MNQGLLTGLTFVATLGAGVIGGVFFAFSSFVMAALARLPPPQGIAAMQAINIVVINPVFLGVFLGTALASVALVIVAFAAWSAPGAIWLLAGGGLYLAGTFGVTMAFNVPRNNALAALDPAAAEAALTWRGYVDEWTAWNHVRAAAAVAAAACLTIAAP